MAHLTGNDAAMLAAAVARRLNPGQSDAAETGARRRQNPEALTEVNTASSGMGSWNDLGFDGDDQRQYEAIPDKLFRLINPSLIITTHLAYRQTGKSWWRFWQ